VGKRPVRARTDAALAEEKVGGEGGEKMERSSGKSCDTADE